MELDRDCEMCVVKMRAIKNKATRDAKTSYGPWAYVCEKCFKLHCSPIKGLSSIINQKESDRQRKEFGYD